MGPRAFPVVNASCAAIASASYSVARSPSRTSRGRSVMPGVLFRWFTRSGVSNNHALPGVLISGTTVWRRRSGARQHPLDYLVLLRAGLKSITCAMTYRLVQDDVPVGAG